MKSVWPVRCTSTIRSRPHFIIKKVVFRFIQWLRGKTIFVLFVIKKNAELEHQSHDVFYVSQLKTKAAIYSKWMLYNKLLRFRCIVPAQLTSNRPFSLLRQQIPIQLIANSDDGGNVMHTLWRHTRKTIENTEELWFGFSTSGCLQQQRVKLSWKKNAEGSETMTTGELIMESSVRINSNAAHSSRWSW